MRSAVLVLVFGVSAISWGAALCADAENVTPTGYAASYVVPATAAVQPNVRLFFSTAEGTDAAPVHVLIRDRAGATWLEQTAQVPVITVSMPPGAYDIAATYNGRRLTRDLAISQHERYLGQFVWD